ncbi:MAG: hypothetical protein HYY01_02775 [Chloroflexi bacterium]|nr:hypothetical protein [Chloroflexota bacterium]
MLVAMLFALAVASAGLLTSAHAAPGPGPGGAAAGAPAPPVAAPPTAPVFTALEIFAGEPLEVPAPLHPSPRFDATAIPSGLPAGSLALFVVLGVVNRVDAFGAEWQIGSPPVFVYASADTRIDNAPRVGDVVKVVGLRTLAPGPIVAERITRRQLGPLSLAAPDVETAFLFTGLTTDARNDIWTVGGVRFVVNDPELPAEIDLGLGRGSTVTVEFNTSAPPAPAPDPAPAPAPAPPPPGGSPAGPFTALEIFAGEPLEVLVALHPSPRVDSTALPPGLPQGSLALFVVQGVVTGVDAARGEWRIGAPPVFVYTSADTRIDNAPRVGDLVKVVALRTLGPGPIVAERITRRQLGPLPAGAPDVEAAFLFTGLVTDARNDLWTAGGVQFIVNDPDFPAEIDLGLGKGSTVTVEFITAPAP